MDSETRTARLPEPIGLSSFTLPVTANRIDGENSHSQPAKLLMLSLLLMTGLCGFIYYGTL